MVCWQHYDSDEIIISVRVEMRVWIAMAFVKRATDIYSLENRKNVKEFREIINFISTVFVCVCVPALYKSVVDILIHLSIWETPRKRKTNYVRQIKFWFSENRFDI
jgi:hypothetical protein